MKITDFEVAFDRLEPEMTVCLLTASTYEYGYWKHYHASPYKVVQVTPNEINLQSLIDEHTWHTLDRKNMISGQFRIEY